MIAAPRPAALDRRELALREELARLELEKADADERRIRDAATHSAELVRAEEDHAASASALTAEAERAKDELSGASTTIDSLEGQLEGAKHEASALRRELTSVRDAMATAEARAAESQRAAMVAHSQEAAARRLLGAQVARQISTLGSIAAHLGPCQAGKPVAP